MFVNSACDSWITVNKRPMTIYDVPGIVRTALPNAITPRNIISGFQVTGIYPFNRDIFSESDFLPSYSTDRPDHRTEVSAVDFSITKQTSSAELSADDFSITNQTNLNRSNSTLSTSKEGNFLDSSGTPGSTPNSSLLPSPEEVRLFEKAQSRKLTKNKVRNRK